MNNWYYLALKLNANGQQNEYAISKLTADQLDQNSMEEYLGVIYQSAMDDTLQDGTSFQNWGMIEISLADINGLIISTEATGRSNFDALVLSSSLNEVLYAMYISL